MEPVEPINRVKAKQFDCADLFCGIDGFHVTASQSGSSCVFTCDIDDNTHQVYHGNYRIATASDITKMDAELMPDRDFVLASFPCQSFNIMDKHMGFTGFEGKLLFEIIKILKLKRDSRQKNQSEKTINVYPRES